MPNAIPSTLRERAARGALILGLTLWVSGTASTATTLTGAEYSVDPSPWLEPHGAGTGPCDEDPGVGLGSPLPPTDGAWDSVIEAVATAGVDPSQLAPGIHDLCVRFKDSTGQWGPARFIHFTSGRGLAGCEYFLDRDPGPDLGRPLPAEDGSFNTNQEPLASAQISTLGLSVGTHVIGARCKEEWGRWGATKTTSVNVTPGRISLNAAVLPYARAVGIGLMATAFASVINSGGLTGAGCTVALPDGIPASFTYQTTDASNALTGTPNTPVDIAPGATQGFVFGITPSSVLAATEIPLVFARINGAPAPSRAGLNTFILSAAASPPPDLLAIGVTRSGDGVVRLPSNVGTEFFASAAVNIGTARTVTVSADDGDRALPLNLRVCETDAAGVQLVCDNNLTRTVGAGQTVFYTVFVTGTGQPVAFDPANNRLFLRFAANGTTVGATNVAVIAP